MSKAQLKIIHIDNDIIKSLVNDYDQNEMEAMSLYYKSQTYTLISDESTKLYEKDQSEIYELLLNELALKKIMKT
jgi:phage regulator Rha-like protein